MAYYCPSDIDFFYFHMYLESSVSFLYFLWLNDFLLKLYLSINYVLVIPIYETCSFSEDTVAVYNMHLENQFPSSRHLDGCLQLHVFVAVLMLFLSFIMHLNDLLHVSCGPKADFYVIFVE